MCMVTVETLAAVVAVIRCTKENEGFSVPMSDNDQCNFEYVWLLW